MLRLRSIVDRSLTLIPLCALLVTRAAPAGAELPRESQWHLVETEHFQVYSNARKGLSEELALELEMLRALLAGMAPTLATGSPKPTYIYLFKTDKSFRPYLPTYEGKERRTVAGFFLDRYDGNYLAVQAERRESGLHNLIHEYLHYFQANNLPWGPTWLNEGVAEFYSSFRRGMKRLEVGRTIPNHLKYLQSGAMIPLEELMTVDQSSPLYNEGSRIGVFYAQSWALTHYFFQGAPERLPQLDAYLKLMRRGVDEPEAFREAFGMPHSGLMTELASYLRSPRFTYTTIGLDDVQIDPEVRIAPVPWQEMLCRLGDLRAHMGRSYLDHAEEHFRAVRAGDAKSACAARGLGFVERGREKLDAAETLFAEAVALAPDDYYTNLYFGETIRLQLREGGTGEPPIEGRTAEPLSEEELERMKVARRHFERAIGIEPEYAEAYLELGRTFSGDPCPQCGVGSLEKGLAMMPFRQDAAVDLLSVYALQGRVADAEALWDRVFAAQPPDNSFSALARAALHRAWVRGAEILADSGRLEDRKRLLERAIERTENSEHKSELAAALGKN